MSTDQESGKGEKRQSRPVGHGWVWPTALVAVVLILSLSAVFVFRSCMQAPASALKEAREVAEVVGAKLADVATGFKQGTVTTSFVSTATTLSGSQYLQIATVSQQETFTRRDESSLAYGYVPLPDVIVEATAPVTYTYYLDLNDHWEFKIENGVITVIAPDIKFNKPAVDASRIAYEVKKNSLFRNTTEAMENLKGSITSLSYTKARQNISLVRDTSRHQTEQFVQNWLAKNFSDGKNYPVKVIFRKELGTNTVVPPKG
jgi:hypothetical protein